MPYPAGAVTGYRMTDERVSRLRARIAAEDPDYNSIVRTFDEDAVAVEGPLAGLAAVVKDNLAVAGTPWTAGIAGRAGVIADRDATAVSRLRAAGASLLASTNMDEAALGAVTDNLTFGRCINPLRAGYTPGGSSGGSAAAVAAGFADLALGTDTLGSVRIPASYCGIAGIKPTYGLVGRSGLARLAPTLDTIGVLARDAGLLWPSILALAGLDSGDKNTRRAPDAWEVRPKLRLNGLVLGVPRQLDDVDLEPEVQAAFNRACDAVRALGATVTQIDLAGWEPRDASKAGLLIIEAEGAVELAHLLEVEGALSQNLRGLLTYGRDMPSAKLVWAYRQMQAVGDAMARAPGDVDAVFLPTTPQRAFPHGTRPPTNQADLTALANFSGCPAVALPVPVPGEDLPASVQLVGPRWSEARLTVLAEALAPALSDSAVRA